MEKMLNEKEVAQLLGIAVATVRQWRYLGRGPKSIKLGLAGRAAVRYRESDITDWIKQNNPSGAADADNG